MDFTEIQGFTEICKNIGEIQRFIRISERIYRGFLQNNLP